MFFGLWDSLLHAWFRNTVLESQNEIENNLRGEELSSPCPIKIKKCLSYNEWSSSPSSSSSMQACPPQAVGSIYLEACAQDRVVTQYSEPPEEKRHALTAKLRAITIKWFHQRTVKSIRLLFCYICPSSTLINHALRSKIIYIGYGKGQIISLPEATRRLFRCKLDLNYHVYSIFKEFNKIGHCQKGKQSHPGVTMLIEAFLFLEHCDLNLAKWRMNLPLGNWKTTKFLLTNNKLFFFFFKYMPRLHTSRCI